MPNTPAPTPSARRGALERPVRPSLLDRLTDAAPHAAAERMPTRRESVEAYTQALRRDLEWLLNTRRQLADVPEGLDELRRSLVRYGLPDSASLLRDAPEARARLLRAVEEAVTAFEPRLAGVRVVLRDAADGAPLPANPGGARAAGALRFTVEGILRLEPEPERVVFDTVFEPSRSEYQVRGGGGLPDA
ncbi:type VI secretion protein [Gemmatimonadetes bacterium T265]|nr:type VI secretion protein [Gemmatimonadetes bacterium T265]